MGEPVRIISFVKRLRYFTFNLAGKNGTLGTNKGFKNETLYVTTDNVLIRNSKSLNPSKFGTWKNAQL